MTRFNEILFWLTIRDKRQNLRLYLRSAEAREEASPTDRVPHPIVLAQVWQGRLDAGEAASKADLARQLGVSRAHVTQTLRLLTIAPQVKAAILALDEPIEGRSVGGHALRSLAKLPVF